MSYQLLHADCLETLPTLPPDSVHAVCTDPPFAGTEFDPEHLGSLRAGAPGIWRVPTTGKFKSPLPKSYALGPRAREQAARYYDRLGAALLRPLRPGGHVLVATLPALQHLVASRLEAQGLEVRGTIVRLLSSFRGGDRPKGAEAEFADLSVVPRSAHEPWVLLRKPFSERTAAQNLRRWGTGALRRAAREDPVWDVIPCGRVRAEERAIAPHPCLKPQAYLRRVVRMLLPTGEGVVLDPFMGSGSTVAAALAIGADAIGIERDLAYYEMAERAIRRLAAMSVAAGPGARASSPHSSRAAAESVESRRQALPIQNARGAVADPDWREKWRQIL